MDQSEETKLALMEQEASAMKAAFSELSASIKELAAVLKNEYVTQKQFAPVERIVYGSVGLVLVAVVGAALTLILK